MLKLFGFLISMWVMLFIGASVKAQEQYNVNIPKDIIILKSTKSYHKALVFAKEAAVALHKELNLRRLQPNKKSGLTLHKGDVFLGHSVDDSSYPYYPARGDGIAANDDYISIEYSDAYKNFARGYYIVVAALADAGSVSIKKQLASIRRIYPNAYTKRTYIWFGTLNE